MRSNRTHFARLYAGAAPLAILLGMTASPAFAQAAATPAPAQAPVAADDTTGPDVVVTGTLFRRTNTETPSPVTVLTSDSLAKAGITSISDAVRSISADSAGSISTGFQNGFSAGGSAVSLRGLGVSSTLVLIDGLRSTNYPLNDDGHNAYVDLNSIPFSLVEQVQVLKDGASSLYGADAIGGVVNLIMRKHFTGLDGRVEGGVSSRGDAGHVRGELAWGYGNYDDKGWNVYIGGEYQKDNAVSVQDRAFPFNTLDLSSIGGIDGNSADSSLTTATINGVVVRTTQSDLNNPLAGGAAPIANGTYINAAGNVANYSNYTSLNLNCAGGTYTVTGGGSRGTACRHDNTTEFAQIQPEQERYSISGRLSIRVSDNIDFYLTGSYAHNQVFVKGAPRPIRNTQPFGGSPGLASSNPGIVLPVYICSSGTNCATAADRTLNPNNPYAAAYAADPANGAARIYYLFGDIPFNSEKNNHVIRFASGLNGHFGDDWNWRVEAVGARDDLKLEQDGYLNIPALLNAINTGAYNFVNPSLNTNAVRSRIAPTVTTKSYSSLISLDASISKAVATLPGGPLEVSVGGQVRREVENNRNQNAALQTYGLTTSSAAGRHTVAAGFFEINAPILDILEVDASGRYDHYSEGFSHFSPKVGFKFTPIKQIAFRGTYSQGFRAPTFAENGATSSYAGFSTFTPPASFLAAHGGLAYGQAYSLGAALAGNPNLRPEKSRSFTLGTIIQPTPWFSFTVDYYNVRKSDAIVAGPLAGAARTAYYSQTTLPAAIAAVAAVGPGYSVNLVDAPDPNFPNALPRVLIINAPFVNGPTIDTQGLDVSAAVRIPIAPGVKFISKIEVTDVLNYDFNPGGGAPVQKYSGTMGPYELSSGAGTPRWRGNWQNTLDFGKYTFTATAYYVGAIKNVAADEGPTNGLSCADNLYGTGDAFCYIRRFINVDVNATIQVNNAFTFYMNVGNVFDAKAPIAPSAYSGTNYLPTWHYAGIIGRTFKAGATFKF